MPATAANSKPSVILNDHLASDRSTISDTYTIVDMALWGWARMATFVLGEDVFAKFPT